jgi:hypothetical protein
MLNQGFRIDNPFNFNLELGMVLIARPGCRYVAICSVSVEWFMLSTRQAATFAKAMREIGSSCPL